MVYRVMYGMGEWIDTGLYKTPCLCRGLVLGSIVHCFRINVDASRMHVCLVNASPLHFCGMHTSSQISPKVT